MLIYKNIVGVALGAIIFILSHISYSLAQPQLLLDMRTGEVLYEKEAGEAWFPASLTKLMTAYVVFEAIADGRVSLNDPVIMSATAQKVPPSRSGLLTGDAVSVEDALALLIVKSANDIANALAETVAGSQSAFVAEMNRAARKMGLSASNFLNPHGLHNKGQVVTARDLAILALSIRARYPQYNSYFYTSEVRMGEVQMKSHNNLLTEFVGTDGMKTGFVCSAGLNIVATARRGGRSLMAIVLGASSARERGEMVAELLLKGFGGELRSAGKNIVVLANRQGSMPTDMRSNICGAGAADYSAARKEAYPFGLPGNQSNLNDDIIGKKITVANLGRIRNVPYPRPRPPHAPAAPVAINDSISDLMGQIVPLPRPRPVR